MTTTEATISMVNRLSEPELRSVQEYINHIFASRKCKAAKMKKYTEQEFISQIDKSIEQSKNNDVYSWEDVRKSARERYEV